MHAACKTIALCVVFISLVYGSPAPKLTGQYFDISNDLAFDSWPNVGGVIEDTAAEDSGVAVVVPKLGLIPTLLKCIPKLWAIKAKIIKTALVVIKWLAPKTILLAVGAIAIFAICKLTNLFSVAYPVVYNAIPPQVLSLVTPQVMQDSQQYLVQALQQYANQ